MNNTLVWLTFAALFGLVGGHGLVTGRVRVKGHHGRYFTRLDSPVAYWISVILYLAAAGFMTIVAFTGL